jgi:hypothetical protein
MTMDLAGVGINRIVTAVDVGVEKSKKLTRASVEYLWLASVGQGEIL